MRKIAILLIVFVLPMIGSAQKSFDKLAKMYNDKKGITVVQLEKDLIDLYKRDNLDKEYLDVLKNIKRVNILTASKKRGAKNSVSEHMSAVKKCFSLDKYKLIKSRVDEWSFAKVYLKKDGNKVSELLVINSAYKTTFTLISLKGDFKLSNINKLSYALNIDGLECLNEVSRNNNSARLCQEQKIENFFHGVKSESKQLKKRIKKIKVKKHDFDEESFEEAMENFGEAMEKWGEAFGENFGKAMESLGETLEELEVLDDIDIVDDNDYSVTIKKGGKAVIHMSPDDDSICIIDGTKVKNSKIEDLDSGEINRIRVTKIDNSKDKFMIITTNKKLGKIKKLNDDVLEFSYKGKSYKHNLNSKNFPGFIVNGKKRASLKSVCTKNILQIRPISKDEKKAFDVKANRIIIEIK